jgi:hypothetical protein
MQWEIPAHERAHSYEAAQLPDAHGLHGCIECRAAALHAHSLMLMKYNFQVGYYQGLVEPAGSNNKR